MLITVRRDKTLRYEDGTPLVLYNDKRGKPVVKMQGRNVTEVRNELTKSPLIKEMARRMYENSRGPVSNGREFRNALGYEVAITTLTAIKQAISEQVFYEINFPDYVPLNVGEGAFSTQTIKYRSYTSNDDFLSGNVDLGANNARLASVDVAIDAVPQKHQFWAKELNYSIMELKQVAASAENWNLVQAKEKARKENWDLGIQRVAFFGIPGNLDFTGLLTLDSVYPITVNTSLIPQQIRYMADDQITAFVQGLIGTFRTNCNNSAWPNRFIIPEYDYTGLGTPFSTAFPFPITRLEYLKKAFAENIPDNMSKEPFKILHCAYSQANRNKVVLGDGSGIDRYTLYNYNKDTLDMGIPVNYTTTITDTINGIHWNGGAYGQYSGVTPYKPDEIMYLDII